PAPATALAVGRLDEDPLADMAVAAGSDLLVIRGRDRRLSIGATRQAQVAPAAIDHVMSVPVGIAALAVGDFAGDSRPQPAGLGADGTLHLVSAASAPRSGAATPDAAPGWQSEFWTA